MSASTASQHPQEQKLLERCQKLGLDLEQTDLLRDLLGWNISSGGPVVPKAYRGIRPQTLITSDTTEKDKELAQAIAQLVHRLIGDELMATVKINPIHVLKGLGLQQSEIAWVVAQLGPEGNCSEIYKEINSLAYKAPELMVGLVTRTLCKLLITRQS